MNTNFINFKKKRELGDILTDTFGFIRQNFVPLFKALGKTTGLAFVFLLCAAGFYMYTSTSSGLIFTIDDNAQLLTVLLSAFVFLASLIVFYALMHGTILNYIKTYVANQGSADQNQIEQGVKDDFWKIIGLGILSSLLLIAGTLLCVLPGIYVYVPMSIVFAILVFNNRSASDAISDSFELIKNEWWITFATLIVLGILAYILSFIFSIPTLIYTFFKTFTAASEGSFSDPSQLFDWVYIVLNVIGTAMQYIILYLVNAVSSAFIFYNLNERKNNTGALEEIEAL